MTDERRTCKGCGQAFAPKKGKHVFCSSACYQKGRAPSPASLLAPQGRFFRRYPHRERKCQARSCGETRVLDLAHKVPVRGRRRLVPKDGEVWVLCPTHHRLLDGGLVSADELGLPLDAP